MALAVVPWTWFLVRGLGGRLEAVAVVLPLLVAGAFAISLMVAAALRDRRVLAVVGSLLLFGIVVTVGPRLPHEGPAPVSTIRVASANVFSENPMPAEAVEAMVAADPDILVAVETSPVFRSLLAGDDLAHPYGAVDDQQVVRSRYPVTALTDPPGVPARRILRVEVDAPSAPFVLYAVHALNPLSESTFADQLRWIDRLLAAAAREEAPVVMAGDFNMSDRQLGYRRLTGTMRDAMTAAGWGHTTYPGGIWAPLLLRIDHIVMPEDWCAARSGALEIPGSDHVGLQVDIGPCP